MADVANALASRAADAVFDGGVNAWNALVRLVRRRFASEPDAAAVLDAAQAQPEDSDPVRALADALEHMAGADGDFDRQLRALWGQVTVSQSARDDGLINSSFGPGGASQIQGRDIDIHGGVHVHSVSASSVSVPRQLPPDVTHFTGRLADLARLDGFLDASSESRTPIVISAVAGVGKTALVVHWSHQVRQRFPDGDLYVNLRGYDPAPPVSAEQVLDGFLRALGVLPERMPPSLDAQASLFRTLLSERRMLIVLDNARSAEQVRPLLPGSPGCLVLVTSRSQLSGLVARDGAQRIPLDMLTRNEAVALLRSIIGASRVDAEPEAADELASRCVNLPLALRIAAEIAVSRSTATLTDLAAELAEGPDRLDTLATFDNDETTAVRSVFSWSVRSLPPQTARAFRLLGLHTGPDLSIAAAAALTGNTITQARKQLDALSDVHLLESVAGRYRFHDLLRDYAEECANVAESEEDRSYAIHRMLAWYLDTAQEADRLLWTWRTAKAVPSEQRVPGTPPPFATRDQAMSWCKTELGNLVAAARQAAASGDDATAWRLASALRRFFQLRMPFTEWLDTGQVGLAAARRLHDRLGEADMLSSLGGAYNYLGMPQESLIHHHQALAIHRDLGPQRRSYESPISTPMVLVNLGGSHSTLGRSDAAFEYLEEALAMAREIGDSESEGHALESLASACQDLAQLDEAVDYLHQSLAVFRDIGYSYGEALTLTRLAEIYLALGQFKNAAAQRQLALEIQHEIGDALGEAWSLGTLVNIYRAMHQPEVAQQYWRRTTALLDEWSHPDEAEIRDYIAAAFTPDNPD